MEFGIEIPQIEISKRTPEVDKLCDIVDQLVTKCQEQAEMIELLKKEINRLKKHKGRPKIKPSKMENGKKDKKKNRNNYSRT